MPRTPERDAPTDTAGKTQVEQTKNYRGRGKKRASAKSKTRKTKSYRGK